MQPLPALFDRVNACASLFLRSINEMGINQVEIIIEEAVVNEALRGKMDPTQLPSELSFLLDSAAPIESVPGCQAFRLYWKGYAAYLVTEECVGSCGHFEDEVFEGDRLRIYSKSHFLDHLARDTGAHGELIHYKITCENHLVDIAAEEPPVIEAIPRQEWTWIKSGR